ncbi:MAG: PKD domain-containing protein [Tepidisphaerales bacterium]
MTRSVVRFALLLVALLASSAQAAWHDPAWPYRRAVDVNLDWEKITDNEQIAVVEFNTCGGQATSGEHVRVHTEAGQLVPARCLMVGPGDTLRVMFALVRNSKRYYVYFGHPKPPAVVPKNVEDIPFQKGVVVELHRLTSIGPADNFKHTEVLWDRNKDIIGRTVIPQFYLGFNPFGDEIQIVARYTGTLTVPADGEYGFAISASDKGGLYVDGKPVVYALGNPGDVRFNAKVQLKKGKHDLMVYHVNFAGEQRLTVVWSPPDQKGWHMIPREALGLVHVGTPGAMEERDRNFIADIRVDYVGECFYENHYVHHYRLTGPVGPKAGPPTKCDWDFGDGQTASGPQVEHVFLVEGDYTVKLNASQGLNKDARSNKIRVTRLHERIDTPPVSQPSTCGKIIAAYEVDKMPVGWLTWATMLNVRARQPEAAEKCAVRLAGVKAGIDANTAFYSLTEAADFLAAFARIDAARRVWAAVPDDSPFQPGAGKHFAHLLLWRAADFPAALKLIEDQLKKHPNDRQLQRLRGQALVLNQRAAEGKKQLEAVPPEGAADRQAALSGALARTTEFYITEGDWETGDHNWDKWQSQFPNDFMEGYSVLLKTRLMEVAKYPEAAAKVAEAFALAVPRSTYAPKLLDRASKLLAKTDAARSQSLHDLLKQKYPEDPLAQ